MEERQFIFDLLDYLPDEPRSYDTADDPGFWSDGEMILCPSETDCSILAAFFQELLKNCNVKVQMGYFDPDEDCRNGEQDDYTGFHYITFEFDQP